MQYMLDSILVLNYDSYMRCGMWCKPNLKGYQMKTVNKTALEKAIKNALEENSLTTSNEFIFACQWYYKALTETTITKKYILHFFYG